MKLKHIKIASQDYPPKIRFITPANLDEVCVENSGVLAYPTDDQFDQKHELPLVKENSTESLA